jgi:hypothetical protein
MYSQDKPHTGLLFDDNAYENTPLKARNVSFQDVVGETSMASLKDFVPVIRNQGGYGTCVGWSSTYYGRTILHARMENITNKEEISANAYSPVFTYLRANVDDDYNCQGGAYIGRAMETMVDEGTPLLKDFNVMCETDVPEVVLQLASENKIKDFVRLFGSNEPDELKIETVKRALIHENPVIIGFVVENSFYTAKNVYEPDNGEETGGHAMCVIGFDDDKYGGSFEIVNSWGDQWGNEGYIWVRYKDFAKYSRYAFEMISQPKKKKKKVNVEVNDDKKDDNDEDITDNDVTEDDDDDKVVEVVVEDEVVVKSVLAGELELKLYDDSKMKVVQNTGEYKKTILGFQDVVIDEETQSIGDYATVDTYPMGTRYRMYAKVSKPAYVYVIGADSNDDSGVLFPHKEGISPYMAYENTSVIVPGEKYWFRLNSDVESDFSIVIFSQDKIDVQAVKKQMDAMKGDLLDKLYVIFNDKLISKDDISLNKNAMGFKAEYTNGTMAMMILDIKRK